MVHGRNHQHLEVLPWTVWESDNPVEVSLGLLVAIKLVQIARIVLLDVVGVGIFKECDTTKPCIHAGLHGWAVLGRSLSCLRCHHQVLLILTEHFLGVLQAHKVVVECLAEIEVCSPCRNLIQVDVCTGTVEVDGVFVCGELPCVIVTSTSFVTISEYLDASYTRVWGDGRRLYHDVEACHCVLGVIHHGCLLRSKVIWVGCRCAITGEDQFLTSEIEAHLVVAKAVYQFHVSVFHILDLDREADGHSILFNAVGCKRLVVAHRLHVLSNT